MCWKPGREIHLKSFFVDGVELRLQLYPNGESNKDKDHTSIYVHNMSPDTIKIDYELSMGEVSKTVIGESFEAYDNWGYPRFFDHNQYSFAHNDSDDKKLEIIWKIKNVWKDFTDGEKIESGEKLNSIDEQMKNLHIKVNGLSDQMHHMTEVMNLLTTMMKF